MPILKQKIILLAVVVFITVFSFAFVPKTVFARGLVPCGGYADDSGRREKPCTVTDAFILIARVTNWLISVAGIYATFKIIQAGFGFTYTMGNEEAIAGLKKQVTNAVVGLALVFMAFMLVNTVANFILGAGLTGSKDPKYKLDLTCPLTYLQVDSTCNK